jgi:hypothetical protein
MSRDNTIPCEEYNTKRNRPCHCDGSELTRFDVFGPTAPEVVKKQERYHREQNGHCCGTLGNPTTWVLPRGPGGEQPRDDYQL